MEFFDGEKTTMFAFVPRPLIVEHRPELACFPLNIMFMTGNNTQLYEPDLSSYREASSVRTMTYFDRADRRHEIGIFYWSNIGKYKAYRFFDGNCIQETTGKDWHNFFIHLTMAGIIEHR